MSVSRYRNSEIVGDRYYATQDQVNKDLSNIQTFSIRITDTDRLDTLAAKYLGDGTYWWIIAELNNLDWSFNFESGQIIKIPVSVEEILKFF